MYIHYAHKKPRLLTCFIQCVSRKDKIIVYYSYLICIQSKLNALVAITATILSSQFDTVA